MTAPLAQTIQLAAERLAEQYKVDAGLSDIVREVQDADAPSKAAKRATDRLRERSRALDDAGEELEQLRTRVDYLRDMLPFTAEGWPEREAELIARLAGAPIDGLALWLDDWFSAAASCRKESLTRLATVQQLPAGTALLHERCKLAAQGLEQLSSAMVDPVLAAGVAGVKIGENVVPENADIRTQLQLVRVRLALNEGLGEKADEVLRALEDSASSASVRALRAQWHRQRDDTEEASRALAEALSIEPTNLDVTAEYIAQSRSKERSEIVRGAARAAIDSLPVLADIEGQLGRLVRPTAELWLAVAERALEERDLHTQALAVARAEDLNWYGDSAVSAAIADAAARGAEARKAPDDELVAVHMQAGIQAIDAGQLEQAAPHFGRILELEPGNGEANLRLADCRVAQMSGRPLAAARETLQSALDSILAVLARGRVDPGVSWCYLSEADARERLAEDVDLKDNDHAWRAFLAVCRSIVHEDSAQRWGELASAAQGLSLYRVAVAATAKAIAMEPENTFAVAQHIQALANAGQAEHALTLLGTPQDDWDDWDHAVRGYLLARVGEPWEAVAELRMATLDPNWSWAFEALITALLVTDRYDEALAEAHAQRDRWVDRLDEVGGVRTSAWSSVVVGDLARAEELAEKLSAGDDEGESHAVIGMVRLLKGDADEGLAALRAKIDAMRSGSDLADWRTQLVAPLRVLASHHGYPVPALDELDNALEERRAVLASREDPVKELDHAPVRSVDPDVVTIARALGSALLLAAEEDIDAALATLERASGNGLEDSDIVSLRATLQAGAPDTPANANGGEVATDVTDASSEEQRYQIEAHLPSSWFAGHEDPLNDHALFLRYIPELRLRAGWDVPPINVRADDDLEPDRFQIFVGEELADEGVVPLEFVYTTSDALKFLGVDTAAAIQDDALELMRIPPDALPSEPLAKLLTMPAFEVVARRIGDVAQQRTAQLGGPTPPLDWRRIVNTTVKRVLKAIPSIRDEPQDAIRGSKERA